MGYSRLHMLDIHTIKAISLDLDDTLWPVWPAIEGAEKALENWLKQHAPLSAALFADPLTRHDLREHVMHTRPDLHHQLSKMRLEAIRLALERSGENVDLAPAAFDVFFAARNCVQLFDDALAMPISKLSAWATIFAPVSARKRLA